MLKGAIDHVSRSEIGGWIYSAAGSLRNQTVLAYLDDVCIGAGPVELFREDLANAGLGDGFVGFRFAVALSRVDEAPLVSVKLEGSDAVIVQPSARLTRRAPKPPRTIVTSRTLASIEWMLGRGWLTQAEYDFLRMMSRFGVYDLSLRKVKTEEAQNGVAVREPLEAAQEMFELACNVRPQVATEMLTQETGLHHEVDRYQSGLIEPIVAVWSPQASKLSLLEGSHHEAGANSDTGMAGAVEYTIGPDRMLFVDLRCRLSSQFAHHVRCYSIVFN